MAHWTWSIRRLVRANSLAVDTLTPITVVGPGVTRRAHYRPGPQEDAAIYTLRGR